MAAVPDLEPASVAARAAALGAAEAALAADDVPSAWAAVPTDDLGTHLCALYQSGIVEKSLGAPAARAPWFARLLADWRAQAAPPRRVWAAQVEGEGVQVAGGPAGAVTLSRAEALRARAWGLGFGAGGVPDAGLEAEHRRALDVALARDLRGLAVVAAALARPPALNAEALGPQLERLVADCLATRWRVDRAPLEEDVLEQTDLRVRLPGTSRRGLRVQVAATLADAATGARHAHKSARARSAGVVLVSPATLAAAAASVPGALAQLPAGGPAVLSRALRDRLTGAIQRATAHPRGPVGHLPEALVRLVCAVVAAGAPGSASGSAGPASGSAGPARGPVSPARGPRSG